MDNRKKIKSPKTGRMIYVGGLAYQRMIGTKYEKKAKELARKAGANPEVPPPSKVEQGIRTRGWRVDAPARGKERQELYHQCGRKCFLDSKNLGFPICPALRTGRACKVDCRGVESAKIRARQYKYQDIYQKTLKYKC